MLDRETKHRIDTARNILVGKVTDPKSQVEQITIALIYKFMSDMDAGSEEIGGKRKFFAGDFERYDWPKLMRTGLGGHETLNLYSEAIVQMPENPGIPSLFRDIFKNAYLTYRDPETLRAFLKVIDEFTYDHPERLGDAYEYLLSILGSQGDVGQFRTPRHIIDFIVAILDPKKNEKIMDPACGTAGFLISSHTHITGANTDDQGNSTLTPDDKNRLAANLKGYDIDPDMVRLSQVNMFLHGLTDPHIHEYDTLTHDDRWNEIADVILANPPFMSPKGGIKPHNRFSIKAKRSEVLFVDYMAEHLGPTGRAGIIVPEGITFRVQPAYKKLRKMLIEEYLISVISLPAGVFNPYTGNKTSILILDKRLAKKTDSIAFFKIENDGFDLGAQRRPIDKNDLPQVKKEISEFLNKLRNGEPLEEFKSSSGLIVPKQKIIEDDEYNLNRERYSVESENHLNSKWPMVELGEVCNIFNGITSKKAEYKDHGKTKIIKVKDFDEDGVYFDKDERGWIDKEIKTDKFLKKGDTLMINAAHSATHVASKIGFLEISPPFKSLPSGEITIFRSCDDIIPVFLNGIIRSDPIRQNLKRIIKGIHIYPKDIEKIKIPLPPLKVQQEIATEIQKIQQRVNANKELIRIFEEKIKATIDRVVWNKESGG